MKCKIIDGSSWADLEKKVDAQREIDMAASVYFRVQS
jgi:endogenous inhibitor of DNA gyrase (YacG/DUF329 family)